MKGKTSATMSSAKNHFRSFLAYFDVCNITKVLLSTKPCGYIKPFKAAKEVLKLQQVSPTVKDSYLIH
jgi:hypothetical protein